MSCRATACLLLLISLVFASTSGLNAQGIVWSGPTFSYTNAAGSNPTLAENQDRLTDDVWLTRATTRGIFNAAPGMESSYQRFVSPSGTEWAYGVLANYASLTYAPWETWNGGQFNVPGMVGQSAVLHLINQDIYLAVTFISWGGNGGGFSYQRSTPLLAVPEPRSEILALAAAALGALSHRRLKSKTACSVS